ncbi:MAG: 30S ribosome-binding factor RbfA [Anaerolineaceae bacterium]|nr:30S ribosome-binding factor RbfA [Anaerolineaceae bacterium]
MTIKQDRMAERIQEILSELLLREVADPRLQNITVTEVKLDRELMFANIYINALAEEAREAEVMAGLERAKGFLRRETARRVRIRAMPELIFHWDYALERGERIAQILEKLDIPPAEIEDETTTEDINE